MTGKPENPPAFPLRSEHGGWFRGDPGMTLRDWFAGQALQGMLAGQWNVEVNATEPQTLANNTNALVGNAYALADAMLNERTKPNG